MSGIALNRLQIGTDCGKIPSEFARMLHSVLANFFDNQVFHLLTSSSSSGEQISGQTYPSFSTVYLTIIRANRSFG